MDDKQLDNLFRNELTRLDESTEKALHWSTVDQKLHGSKRRVKIFFLSLIFLVLGVWVIYPMTITSDGEVSQIENTEHSIRSTATNLKETSGVKIKQEVGVVEDKLEEERPKQVKTQEQFVNEKTELKIEKSILNKETIGKTKKIKKSNQKIDKPLNVGYGEYENKKSSSYYSKATKPSSNINFEDQKPNPSLGYYSYNDSTQKIDKDLKDDNIESNLGRIKISPLTLLTSKPRTIKSQPQNNDLGFYGTQSSYNENSISGFESKMKLAEPFSANTENESIEIDEEYFKRFSIQLNLAKDYFDPSIADTSSLIVAVKGTWWPLRRLGISMGYNRLNINRSFGGSFVGIPEPDIYYGGGNVLTGGKASYNQHNFEPAVVFNIFTHKALSVYTTAGLQFSKSEPGELLLQFENTYEPLPQSFILDENKLSLSSYFLNGTIQYLIYKGIGVEGYYKYQFQTNKQAITWDPFHQVGLGLFCNF